VARSESEERGGGGGEDHPRSNEPETHPTPRPQKAAFAVGGQTELAASSTKPFQVPVRSLPCPAWVLIS
jgi:hypothetical protein